MPTVCCLVPAAHIDYYIATANNSFDLLFDITGESIQPENEQLVNNIENFFEKKFTQGLMDGIPCYIHSYN